MYCILHKHINICTLITWKNLFLQATIRDWAFDRDRNSDLDQKSNKTPDLKSSRRDLSGSGVFVPRHVHTCLVCICACACVYTQ